MEEEVEEEEDILFSDDGEEDEGAWEWEDDEEQLQGEGKGEGEEQEQEQEQEQGQEDVLEDRDDEVEVGVEILDGVTHTQADDKSTYDEKGGRGKKSENENTKEGDKETQQRRRWDAQSKEVAREVHKSHVLVMLARASLLEKCLWKKIENGNEKDSLDATIQSFIPSPLVERARIAFAMDGKGTEDQSRSFAEQYDILRHVLAYFRSLTPIIRGFGRGIRYTSHHTGKAEMMNKRVDPSKRVHAYREVQQQIHDALISLGAGTTVEIATALFCVLLRALGLQVRLVTALNPLNVSGSNCLDEEHKLDDSILHLYEHSNSKRKYQRRNKYIRISKQDFKGEQKTDVDIVDSPLNDNKDVGENMEKKNPAQALISDEIRSDSLRRGDAEFEADIAMAIAASKVEIKRRSSKEKEGDKKRKMKGKEKEVNVGISTNKSDLYFPTRHDDDDDDLPVTHWIEALMPDENKCIVKPPAKVSRKQNHLQRWVPIDVYRLMIDCCSSLERVALLGRPMSYCVAINDGNIRDVTRRYAQSYSASLQRRYGGEKWWNATIELFNQMNGKTTPRMLEHTKEFISGSSRFPSHESLNASKDLLTEVDGDLPKKEGDFDEEENELRACEMREKLPTAQAEYQKHRLFALERYLTAYQVIHPRTSANILGYVNGQPVFPRENVQTVHSVVKWKRLGRIVRLEELGKPVKMNTKQPKSMKNKKHHMHNETGNDLEMQAGEEEQEDEVVKVSDGSQLSVTTQNLFGFWQTDPYIPPPAENGIVPRNSHGNIEIWSPTFVPQGATHLHVPSFVMKIARELDIDCVPAMVGFEMRRKKLVPKFDGVVVCSEFADILRDACMEEQARREERISQRKMAEAMMRWRVLLRIVWRRHQLEKENNNERAPLFKTESMAMPSTKLNIATANEKTVKRTMITSEKEEAPHRRIDVTNGDADNDGSEDDLIFREHFFD